MIAPLKLLTNSTIVPLFSLLTHTHSTVLHSFVIKYLCMVVDQTLLALHVYCMYQDTTYYTRDMPCIFASILVDVVQLQPFNTSQEFVYTQTCLYGRVVKGRLVSNGFLIAQTMIYYLAERGPAPNPRSYFQLSHRCLVTACLSLLV